MNKNFLTLRLSTLVDFLLPCKKFADVGCDHGYIAKTVLDEGISEEVVISDISKKSLNKTINLLSSYSGRVTSLCASGMKGYPDGVDEALIAGMGGEEIVKIITSADYIPNVLVCQPMKNADKVRRVLLSSGYNLTRDTMFFADGKYYFVMRAEKGNHDYSENEILWGRENLSGNPVFKEFVDHKILRLKSYCENADSHELKDKIAELEKLKNEIK